MRWHQQLQHWTAGDKRELTVASAGSSNFRVFAAAPFSEEGRQGAWQSVRASARQKGPSARSGGAPRVHRNGKKATCEGPGVTVLAPLRADSCVTERSARPKKK